MLTDHGEYELLMVFLAPFATVSLRLRRSVKYHAQVPG